MQPAELRRPQPDGRGHRREPRHHPVALRDNHRGQRGAAAAAVHRHRRDDRLRPAAFKPEDVPLRRGGAVRHFLCDDRRGAAGL